MKLLGALLRGIFDPLYLFFIALAGFNAKTYLINSLHKILYVS